MPTYPLTEIEKKAWDFAEKAHYGVFRKFRNATYFDGHVRKVFGLVKQYDTTPQVGAASLLHDCVEDVDDITYETILSEFGKEIADLVKELTSCEEYIDVMGKPDYLLDKMVTMSDKALIIKLCDRWQNISDSFSQQESFRDKYYKETRYIMNGLKSNRQLNQVHKRIIEQIEGILGNLKSRYKYESKHVLMFEDFKQKNVTIEDIIKCIEGGGVIYATTINDFPDNDPEIPLNPLSIDDEGTITVELDGSNHEVELKNVDKIEWKNINERMYFSDGMQSVLIYLSNQKKDKVANFIWSIQSYDYYKDTEIINYIGLDKLDNMISYLPTNKRTEEDLDGNFNSTQKVSIRVGRAIKRIYEILKPKLNYKKSTNARIFKHQDRYLINIPEKISNEIITFSNDSYIKNSECIIKGTDFKIEGQVYDINQFWTEFETIDIIVSQNVTKDFPILRRYYDISEIKKYKMDIPVEIEIKNDFELSDSDIEKFVNEYISYVKYSKSDETSTIKEVKGEDIRVWYSKENYQSEMGKLGNSCMSHEECGEYFDIYTNNPDSISLLILTNKNNKLVGRALLWKLDSGEFFMDRVYTSNDSDDNIFINYAIEKGYLYRDTPASGFKYFINSKEVDPGTISVTLDEVHFNNYPFIDTLCYLDGYKLNNTKGERTFKDTDGHWSEYYESENDYD